MDVLHRSILLAAVACLPCATDAAQFEIQGPPGSGRFGSGVAALPNGNIVITDPWFSLADAQHVGAIHLYRPDGSRISTVTGSQLDDQVGSGQIVVLGTGHVVVSSPNWSNGSALNAGAVTCIDADHGLSGVISAQNSLVGSTDEDRIGGYDGIVPLSNGHYVVASPSWSKGSLQNVGAVTWANGQGGTVGEVSASNSLVGSEAGDNIGTDQNLWGSAIIALPNGHYVVPSWFWHGQLRNNYGAITWGNGEGGTVGEVSAANSLLGTSDCSSDIGAPSPITVLANGDFLVSSPCWDNGEVADVGAVTWASGSNATIGEVAPGNSLIGDQAWDRVGAFRALTLSNGNYVVLSGHWHGGLGAATWGDGAKAGLHGVVSADNSLVGTNTEDYIGTRALALANGHYVVGSYNWSSPTAGRVGALTWADGTTGRSGQVSVDNSLIGSTQNDVIGFRGITALSNGNYVVASPSWSNGPIANVGAVTLVDGAGPVHDVVGPHNSLIGSQADDSVGDGGVSALPNGGFVVVSPYWNRGSISRAGAVTWVDGMSILAGEVSAANSLVGSKLDDRTGSGGVTLLASGDIAISSYPWDRGDLADAGAVTWIDGGLGKTGPVHALNSMVGAFARAQLRLFGPALTDGHYLVASSNAGGGFQIATLTLVDGRREANGAPLSENTLHVPLGFTQYNNQYDYDAARGRLVVGRASENGVTLITTGDVVFNSGFEPAPLGRPQDQGMF